MEFEGGFFWSFVPGMVLFHAACLVWERTTMTGKAYGEFTSTSIVKYAARLYKRRTATWKLHPFGRAIMVACEALLNIMKGRAGDALARWENANKSLLAPHICSVVDLHFAKNSDEPVQYRCMLASRALLVFQKVGAGDLEKQATQFLLQQGHSGSERRGTSGNLSLRKFSIVAEDDKVAEAGQRTVLVGRDDVIAPLTRQVLALREQTRGNVAYIEGDSGVGKSALLVYLSEIASGSIGHVRSVKVEAEELDMQSSLSVCRKIISPLLEGLLAKGDTLSVVHVSEFLTSTKLNGELLPLLEPVLPFEVADNETTEAMTAAARYSQTLQLVEDVLKAIVQAVKTMVVVVDNLQWSDKQSLAIFTKATKIDGLLMVLGGRKEEDNEDILRRVLGSEGSSRKILLGEATLLGLETHANHPPLTRLSRTGALEDGYYQEVLKDAVDASSVEPPVFEYVKMRAGSNLFVAQLIMTGMKDRGAVTIGDDGSCYMSMSVEEVEGGDQGNQIEGAAGVISSRLAQLPFGEKNLLQTASTFGVVVPIATLAVVHMSVVGGTEHDLLGFAQSLLRKNFLRRDKKRPDFVEFENGLTQKVIYEQMLVSQRELVHARIADELEMDNEQKKNHLGLILRHCESSGDLRRTRKYLLEAGLGARRMGNAKDTVFFLEKLVSFDKLHGTKYFRLSESSYSSFAIESGVVLNYLGMGYYSIGNFGSAIANLESGFALLGVPLPRSSSSQILSVGSWAFSNIALGRQPRSTYKSFEKKYGRELVRDIVISLGSLGQARLLSDAPPLHFLQVITKMHAIAVSINEPESICHRLVPLSQT